MVGLENVGVGEVARQQDFAAQPNGSVVVGAVLTFQKFDCDIGAQQRVVRFVDFSGGALSEAIEQLIATIDTAWSRGRSGVYQRRLRQVVIGTVLTLHAGQLAKPPLEEKIRESVTAERRAMDEAEMFQPRQITAQRGRARREYVPDGIRRRPLAAR